MGIDLDAFEGARQAHGTIACQDTVNATLRKVAREQALEGVAGRIRWERVSAPTPEEFRQMRKPRTLFERDGLRDR